MPSTFERHCHLSWLWRRKSHKAQSEVQLRVLPAFKLHYRTHVLIYSRCSRLGIKMSVFRGAYKWASKQAQLLPCQANETLSLLCLPFNLAHKASISHQHLADTCFQGTVSLQVKSQAICCLFVFWKCIASSCHVDLHLLITWAQSTPDSAQNRLRTPVCSQQQDD